MSKSCSGWRRSTPLPDKTRKPLSGFCFDSPAGMFATGEDDNGNLVVGCIIPDATQCCAQGVQFFWNEEPKYPDDYPQEGETITVEGVFDYEDAGYTILLKLTDAELWRGIQPRQG